jgi:cell fate (sporulation/competence/biofilm development) regulator YlbF (YheA/YmcA/DUF963 family)
MAENFDDILALAHQIGQAIRQHPRYIELKESDARVRADKSATSALDAYNKAAAELARKERAGMPIEVADKQNFERLKTAVVGHETIKAFMRTQADYAELMRRMNEAIFEAIRGPEEAGHVAGPQ